MTDVNTAVAEPSAAAAPIITEFNPSDQSTWTPDQREDWNKTGDVPEPPKKAEAAPAKKESEAKAESAEGSDTSKNSQEKPKHKKLSAEERIAELEAKREKDAAIIESIRKNAGIKETKAEPSPAKQVAPKLEAPKKPELKDFEDFEKYETARDKYFEELAEFKAKKAVEEDRNQREWEIIQEKTKAEYAEARKVYPDFDEKAGPIVKALTEDQSIHEAFKIAVGTSDVFTHLAYALSQEQTQALLELGRTNPILAVKKLGVLEAEVRAELGKKTAIPEKPEEKTPQPVKPRAPKPPSEVGGRGTSPEDVRVQAAKDGNFAAFSAAESARKFAKSA